MKNPKNIVYRIFAAYGLSLVCISTAVMIGTYDSPAFILAALLTGMGGFLALVGWASSEHYLRA
jgi:hypothetical protein